MKKVYFTFNLVILFCVFFSSEKVFAQLGFCNGNSGDSIFTENFGTGIGSNILPAGTTTYNYIFGFPNDGFYTVRNGTFGNGFDWHETEDHTPGDTNGKCLIVNASFATGEFYRTTVTGLCENTTYEFSAWLLNLVESGGFCSTTPGGTIPINVRFEIWDNTDTTLLASGNTGNITEWFTPIWQQFALVFQTAPGETSVILKMLNNGNGGCGNDLAIDDIVFKSCGDSITVQDAANNSSVVICSSQTPYATTLTATPDGSVFISPEYQWQDSTDGITWTNIAGETAQSINLAGINTTRFYRVKVAEVAANVNNSLCNVISDVYQVTVNPTTTITGTLSACIGGTTQLTGSNTASVAIPWVSSNIAVATVDNTGLVSGLTIGTANITYTDTNGCTATETVTITTATITGTLSACIGGATQLTGSGTANGTTPWVSSDNAVATVDNAGLVSGLTNGTTDITYTDSNGCTATETITINSNPTLTGTLSACIGGTTQLTGSGTANGITPWISTDTAVATVNNIGLVNGVSNGTTDITFTDTNGCTVTETVTINSTPTLTGTLSVCIGGTTQLTGSGTASGTTPWVSSDTAVASVDNTGLVNGLANGTTDITYTDTNGCTVTETVTITTTTITGTLSACIGATTQLTGSGTANGTTPWVSSNLAVATVDNTGLVSGLINGTTDITYTDSNGCTATETVIIITTPTITGMLSACIGATIQLTGSGTANGTMPWVSSDTAVATVNNTGLISGLTAGTSDITYTDSNGCNVTETITINGAITIATSTPLEVCDDGTPDGLTVIDLSLKTNEISGGNPAYAVTYYLTQADADAEVNPLAIPYTNISNPQTIYVRVEDINTGCYDTTTLDLVVEQAPVAFTPTALEFCDPDSDGFGEFDLDSTIAQITGGAPGLTVTFHETMADAGNNVNAQASPYNNIVVNTQTIYVRVESATIATDCATFVDLVLIVNPTPQITDPTPLEVCDNDADGFAIFDLPTKDPEILNQLDGDATNDLDSLLFSVSYYVTQADAQAPMNTISSPNAYLNTTMDMQTLWVRVEDNATGCNTITTLDLIVNPLPVLVQPDPISLCDVNNPGDEIEEFTLEDANAQILNGQTGISLSYFSTQAGADTNDTTLEIISPYMNTATAQTIYVRAENDVTGCVNTITLDLRVTPLPSPIAMPVVVEECDEDNDGFALFDLDAQSPIIVNGEPNVTISYYETEADAMSMTNSLVSPYANVTANTQTIYVLAVNTGSMTLPATGCFTIVELPLAVIPSPVVPIAIDDYVICDDNNDGFNQFNFDAVINPQLYIGGQTPANFPVTYHTTQADADTGNNPIVNTTNYTNATNPQTIYIRLVSNANGCVTTGSFVISVNLPPVIDAAYDNELSLCDDLDADYMEANNGATSFDLTVEDIEITGLANVSWIVTYYETLAEAQTDTNAIADPTAYTNTMIGPQTLYVRVTDVDTGCFSFTTLTIRVLPNPSPSPDPVDLELCDDIDIVGPNDLLEVFDLTQNEAFIINSELGVTATYHITQDGAIMGNNAIVDPTLHTNEDPAAPGVAISPQTIYVRVTNTGTGTVAATGCYSLVSFDVIVNPLPVVTPVADYVICEFMTDDIAEFDFTTMTDGILNGQDPAVFTVTYHETQGEADTAMNDLIAAGLYTNTSDPQTIYVNITNTVTGCNTTALSFDLRVDELAEANADGVAILYEVCDDNMEFDGDTTNDMAAFNLTTQNDFVLDGQDPLSYTVTYYDNQADADAGTNALPFAYTNTVNPQVIIARVDNDTMIPDGMGGMIDSSSCYETAELTLLVNPMPSFMLDPEYLLCINTNGSEVINSPVVDTGLDPALYTFVWTLDGTVLPTETGATIAPASGGTYSVVATDSTTGCVSTPVSTFITVSEPPVVETDITSLTFANQHDILVMASASSDTNNSIAVYEFSLDGGAWEVNTPNDSMYTFTDVTPGEHVITVRDIIGCGETSITIMVMDYPHFFTPNGDGYHDTWNVYDIGTQPDAVIYIFDRFGKLLKQLNPTGAGWDGTYNGNPMPTSDYWFTLEYREPSTNEKKVIRKHFTLKR